MELGFSRISGWGGLFLPVDGHLTLKLQESVSEIPSRSEKHPMRKTTIEVELGCFWTLRGGCRLQTTVHCMCQTLKHSPTLSYSLKRPPWTNLCLSPPQHVSEGTGPNYECHHFCCSCSLEFRCRPNVYGGKHDYLQSQALMMVIIMTAIVGRACNYVDSSFYCTYNNKLFYLRAQGSWGKVGHLFH